MNETFAIIRNLKIVDRSGRREYERKLNTEHEGIIHITLKGILNMMDY